MDDAKFSEGALRFVPGSHLAGEPICALARQPAVEVPAKAGDVIVHDMMVAHSSEPMEGNALRRVIYLEFLSVELALGESIYTREEIDNRRRLPFAARRYRRAMRWAESWIGVSGFLISWLTSAANCSLASMRS